MRFLGCLLVIGYMFFSMYIAAKLNEMIGFPGFLGFLLAESIPFIIYFVYREMKKRYHGCIAYSRGIHKGGIDGVPYDKMVTLYLYKDKITFDDIQIITIDRIKKAEAYSSKTVDWVERQIGGGRKNHYRYFENLDLEFVGKSGGVKCIHLQTEYVGFKGIANKINQIIGYKEPIKERKKNESKEPYEI